MTIPHSLSCYRAFTHRYARLGQYSLVRRYVSMLRKKHKDQLDDRGSCEKTQVFLRKERVILVV